MILMSEPYSYHCTLIKVIDGDTIDVDIDLGFNVTLKNQRLRLYGINTPETRTRDLEEKARGLAAKSRLVEILPNPLIIKSMGRGKYGRILALPFNREGKDICKQLVDEGYAEEYMK
jgi:micrococcal nuclease